MDFGLGHSDVNKVIVILSRLSPQFSTIKGNIIRIIDITVLDKRATKIFNNNQAE